MPISLLVADDQEIIRVGLASLLRGSGIEIVAEADCGSAAVRSSKKFTPDVVLLDVVMPGENGLVALEQLKHAQPATPVIVWSAFDNWRIASAAAMLGASGVLLKSAGRNELLNALRGAVAAEVKVDRRRVHNSTRLTKFRDEIVEPLSTHEIAMLRLVALGAANLTIAGALQISVETVTWTLRRINRKIGVVDRAQSAIWAARKRLI